MFDILVCCYGDYLDISKKCLDSILSFSSNKLNIHIGLNECGIKTKNYCRNLLDNKKITTLIDSNININKDPMMRKLIDCVNTDYFLWLDDDTFPIQNGWEDLINKSLSLNYDVAGFTHVTGRNSYAGYKNFVEERPWFNSWEKYNEYNDNNLNNDHIPFPIGFLWVGKTEYFRKHNFPDRNMIKKCDDMLLGEMIYQTNGKFQHLGHLWNYFDKNTSHRRGYGEESYDGWIMRNNNNKKQFNGLTIYPTGGMCNRIRNFVSAYALCKEKDAKLKYLHEISSDLVAGAKFDDYWHIPIDVEYENLSTEEIMVIHNRELKNNNIYRKIPHLDGVYHNHWGLCVMENETVEKEGLNRLKNNLYKLKLKDTWQEKINNFVEKYNIKGCIGLHIRSFEFLFGNRSEQQDSTLVSNFLKNISDGERIFLATDSRLVQNSIKEILKDKVIVYKHIINKDYLDRTSVEDFETGLMDFYILTKCKKIFGTKGSSYSHLAGILCGGVEWVMGSQDAKEWEG